jgi:uncharacterized protein YlxW (UPF0749 family)
MDTPATMGLRGIWATVANVTAVVLICVLFVQQTQDQRQQAREDRDLYRSELRSLHDQSAKDLQMLHDDAASQRQAVQMLTTSVQSLADDVRAIKREKARPEKSP